MSTLEDINKEIKYNEKELHLGLLGHDDHFQLVLRTEALYAELRALAEEGE